MNLYFKAVFAKNYALCEPVSVRLDSPTWNDYRRCLQSVSGKPVEVAVFGDSHAEHLFPGLVETLPEKNIAYYVHGRGPPFRDIGEIQRLMDFLSSQSSIKDVIISSNWHARMKRIGKDSSLYIELSYLVRNLTKAGKRVYLVEGFPTFSFDPSACKFDRLWPLSVQRCTDSKEMIQSQYRLYSPSLEQIGRDYPSVRIIRTFNYLGKDGYAMSLGDEILFRDRSHLTYYGSRYIAQRMLTDYPELAF